MSPAEPAVATARHARDERPTRRRFETAKLPAGAEVGAWIVGIGGAVALLMTPVPFVALAWLVLVAAVAVVVRANQSRRPADAGLQIYDEAGRPDLLVPYGLALGWFVRRGLVGDWFRTEAGGEVDDLLAGNLSGPQLYGLWHGILASDMLSDEGAAFARRYLWGIEPHGALQVDRIAAGRPFGRNAWPHPRPDQQWFVRDLETLAGEGNSAYLLPDTPETAAAFDRLADARLARWRRWRLVFALYESERVAVRRKFERYYAFPA